MHVLLAIVVACGLAAVLYALTREGRRKPRSVDSLREELVQMTRDQRVADRLVARMREQHPGLSEAGCYRRAIEKLRYDSRR